MKIAYKVTSLNEARSEDARNQTVTLSPLPVDGMFAGFPMISFPVEEKDLDKYLPGDEVLVEITPKLGG